MIINRHLMSRYSKSYDASGSKLMSKPIINPHSNKLSYKDDYAHTDVFQRLQKGREQIMKDKRMERRFKKTLNPDQQAEEDHHEDHEEAHQEGDEYQQEEAEPQSPDYDENTDNHHQFEDDEHDN